MKLLFFEVVWVFPSIIGFSDLIWYELNQWWLKTLCGLIAVKF